MRLTLQESRCAVAVLALGTLAVPCIAATTIDFETPSVRNSSQEIINPYVASGVTFTSGGYLVGLVKENALTGCARSGANQLLGTGLTGAFCAIGESDGAIRADWPAGSGSPVNMVSVDVQTGHAGLWLLLHGESGEILAATIFSPVFPAYGTCTEGIDGMTRRGTVRAVAPVPVAYATIFKSDWITCPAAQGGCTDGCQPFAIDNFTFGFEPFGPPPVVQLTPGLLWPPNHELAPVRVWIQAQNDCEFPQVVLASITSDEPDEGTSDGDLPGDIQGADLGTVDFDFALRSERAEEGNGRSYTVCYEVRCGTGEVIQECATVEVPHDGRGQATM